MFDASTQSSFRIQFYDTFKSVSSFLNQMMPWQNMYKTKLYSYDGSAYLISVKECLPFIDEEIGYNRLDACTWFPKKDI